MGQKNESMWAHTLIGIGMSTFIYIILQFCINPSRGSLSLRFSMVIIGAVLIVAGFIIRKKYVKIDKEFLLSISSTRRNFCADCGTPVASEAVFCTHCGKQI
jgi:hypothetical protein